jgi:hypothetical protein
VPQQTWPLGQQVAVAPEPQQLAPAAQHVPLQETVVADTQVAVPPPVGVHDVDPAGHTHVPPAQIVPLAQTVPHAPQLVLLVLVLSSAA